MCYRNEVNYLDESYVIAVLVLSGVIGFLPDIYRLLNNNVLSRIFHFKKIEDVNYCCGGMIQFTFMLVLALFFLVAGG